MRSRIIYLLMITFSLSLIGIACEGPEGPAGSEGPVGPQGEQGPKGDEGTANVMYSEWLPIEWDANASDFKEMYIDAPEITEEFLEDGTILCYLRLSNGQVFSVPMTYRNFSWFFFTVDQILTLSARRIEGMTGDISLEFEEVRYVLIPGGIPLKIDSGFWEDYEAVAEYYDF